MEYNEQKRIRRRLIAQKTYQTRFLTKPLCFFNYPKILKEPVKRFAQYRKTRIHHLRNKFKTMQIGLQIICITLVDILARTAKLMVMQKCERGNNNLGLINCFNGKPTESKINAGSAFEVTKLLFLLDWFRNMNL